MFQMLLRQLPRYTGAIFILVLAVLLHEVLYPTLGDRYPFLVYYGALVLTAWLCGLVPSLLTLIASALLVIYTLSPPGGFLWLSDATDWISLSLYLASGLGIIGMAESLRASRARVQISEERLRLAAQAAAFGTFDANLLTGKSFWSPELKFIFGLSAETPHKLDADWVPTAVHPEDRERVRRVVRAALDPYGPGELQDEHRIVRSDGSVRWVLLKGRTVFAGEGVNRRAVRLLGAILDTTERQEASAALQRSEAEYRAMFELSAVGMGQADCHTGRLLRVNRKYCEMLGYAAEELLNMNIQDITHPDDVAKNLELLGQAVHRGIDDYTLEKRFVRKDGQIIWAQVTATIFRDRQGRPLYIVAVIQDLTERKRMEEALRETDRRKDEFLATLAHELRNPLTPISNALQLLKRGASNPSVVDNVLGMAERQMEQLVRLVDDLLDISRISRGKITLHKERVALDAVIQSALETARPHIEAAGHRLVVELPEAHVYLDADLTRLAQALSNLLINAAKYTEAGGQIRLTAHCEGEELLLDVRDTGIGIPREQLGKVFELFAQIEQPGGRVARGLGVGLALVKSLMELHGGSVQVASAGPGQGSTFTLRLPLTVTQPAAHELSEPVSAANTASTSLARRILVVDDDEDVANSTALLLKTLGYEVHTVYGGAAAIEAALAHRPEIILLDVGMPGMDGYEVARRLRQEPTLQGTLLVAMTGWGQEADRQRSRAAGFDHHLVKPVDLATLEALLKQDPGQRAISLNIPC